MEWEWEFEKRKYAVSVKVFPNSMNEWTEQIEKKWVVTNNEICKDNEKKKQQNDSMN